MQVFQISRHGNRAPSYVFEHLKKDENIESDSFRSLHKSGETQMQKMVDNFIKIRYKDSLYKSNYEVYSTLTDRTIDSAMVQYSRLFGEFPQNREAFAEYDFVNIKPLHKDILLHQDKKTCRLLKKIINHVKQSEH